jgi:peptidoglycan/LPS O-acetylase OafA/YrhL
VTSVSIAAPLSQKLSELHSATAADRRFHELDSIRGIAALIVVFHHFFYMWFYSQMVRTDLRALLWYPLVAGHESVILFFLLSGFVLSVPYLRGREQSYPVFLLRRILRIYCPYLCALALAVAANAVWHGKLPMASAWSNMTWATPVNWTDVSQGILMLGHYNFQRFDTAFWSLVEEMRISIIFPLLFLFARRAGVRITLFTAAACCLVIHFADPMGPQLRSMINSLQFVAVFLCGILMALHLDKLAEWYRHLSRVRRVALAASSFLLFELSHLTFLELFRGSWRLQEWHIQDWPLIAGAVGLMLVGLKSRHARRVLNSTVPSFLGRISYSLYLVHGTVLFALAFLLQGRASWATALLIYLPVTLLISTTFCFLIEEPFMRLGRKLGQSQKRAIESSTLPHRLEPPEIPETPPGCASPNAVPI